MNPLLRRVLGRLSPDENPDLVAHSAAPASDSPAANASVEASGDAARASLTYALRQHVAEGSGGRLAAQEIREDAQLFDRGYLDSFSYVEFLAFIEQTYGVRIDDSQLAGQLNTIAAMAAHILQEQAPATD